MSSTRGRTLVVQAAWLTVVSVVLPCAILVVVAVVTRDRSPALPSSFLAGTSRDALSAELDLAEVWSTTHPEYDGEVRVLISSAPVEGSSPNYRAAFYHRRGDVFVRIGRGFGFGGYHPPELGQHPTLDIPAIVAVMETVPDRTYFFVHDGTDQTLQENDETWVPVDELR